MITQYMHRISTGLVGPTWFFARSTLHAPEVSGLLYNSHIRTSHTASAIFALPFNRISSRYLFHIHNKKIKHFFMVYWFNKRTTRHVSLQGDFIVSLLNVYKVRRLNRAYGYNLNTYIYMYWWEKSLSVPQYCISL